MVEVATRGECSEAASRRRWLLAAAWAAVAAGVVLRLLAATRMDIWEDGVEYVEMGRAWSQGRGFLLPDSERIGPTRLWGPGYSHHFPPAFPFGLGLIFSVIGCGVLQAKAALVTLSLAALGAVYASTRNLYGADRAVLVAGLVALEPSLVWVTGIGLSENFTLLFSTLTLWAFLRSLEDRRFLLPAGVFWTVVYLARSSAGALGILPAAAGAWWWWKFRGWRALFDGWCITAGLVFVAAVVLWGRRNHNLFGDWATSAYVRMAYDYGLAHPSLMAKALIGNGTFFLFLLVAYAIPFAPEVKASFQRLRQADTSILWLFVLVIWGLAWLVTSVFSPYEGRSFFSLDHYRYILLGVVPLMWIAVREAKEVGVLLARWAGLATVLLMLSGAVLLFPVRESSARAAEFVDPYLRDGDDVIIGGSVHKYDLNLHFSRIDRISIHRMSIHRMSARTGRGVTPEFIFLGDKPPARLPRGFELVGTFEQRGLSPSVTYVISRTQIIQARGLPTHVTRSYR